MKLLHIAKVNGRWCLFHDRDTTKTPINSAADDLRWAIFKIAEKLAKDKGWHK
jgi:hypothetical protein